MRIELLSIGDELLTGKTTNTNASFIANELLSKGMLLKQVVTTPDHKDTIVTEVKTGLSRSDVLILTGGLGPTGDDVTRQALCKFFDKSLQFNEEIAKDLQERFGKELASLEDQATVPSDVIIIRNKLGTAPGFIFERDGKAVIALPGVPSQMEQMLVDDVIPFLEKTYENSKKVFHRSLYFCQMNENQIDPLLRQMEKKYQGLEIGVCPSYGKLAVYLKGQNEKSLISSQKEIKEAFLTHCYSDSESKIQMALHQTLLEKGRTLSLAESCTGGKIASMITSLPEASLYFLGGVVAYSNLLKQKSLGVLESTLHQFGAVSQETVCEMAKGIEALTSADYSIAVSGVAGPSGGTKDKPVGTIWGAISQKDKILFSGKITAKGILHRTTLINYTANYLISSLWRWIHYNIPPFTHE